MIKVKYAPDDSLACLLAILCLSIPCHIQLTMSRGWGLEGEGGPFGFCELSKKFSAVRNNCHLFFGPLLEQLDLVVIVVPLYLS